MLLLCMPIWCVAADYTPNSSTCQFPSAQMRSTSAYISSANNTQRNSKAQQYAYRGIRTSASSIKGGVTTYDNVSNSPSYGPRRYSPGVPGFPTPIDLDTAALLFFALLSGLYAYRKHRRSLHLS